MTKRAAATREHSFFHPTWLKYQRAAAELIAPCVVRSPLPLLPPLGISAVSYLRGRRSLDPTLIALLLRTVL
jgi:hypothetical protein